MGFRDSKSGIKSVCYECENRHPACHDTCETYIEAKEEYETRKQTIKAIKDEIMEYDHYKYHKIRQEKNQGRNHGKSYNHRNYKR